MKGWSGALRRPVKLQQHCVKRAPTARLCRSTAISKLWSPHACVRVSRGSSLGAALHPSLRDETFPGCRKFLARAGRWGGGGRQTRSVHLQLVYLSLPGRLPPTVRARRSFPFPPLAEGRPRRHAYLLSSILPGFWRASPSIPSARAWYGTGSDAGSRRPAERDSEREVNWIVIRANVIN